MWSNTQEKQGTRDCQTVRPCCSTTETMGLAGVPILVEFQWQKRFPGFGRRKRLANSYSPSAGEKQNQHLPFFFFTWAPAQHREGPHTNHCSRTWALGGNSTETSNTLKIIQMKRCWCWWGKKHPSWHLSILNSAIVTVSGLDSRTVFLKQQEPCLLHQF